MYDILLKLIVIGDSNVGKTSLLQKFIENKELSHQVPTIGVDYFTTILNIDYQKVKLQIWDTAGQEIFKSIVAHYYKIAIGAIVIFDLSSYESFKNCEYWVNEYFSNRETGKIILVGNKEDLKHEVPEKDIIRFCNIYNCKYIKCSLMNNSNTDLNIIFYNIVNQVLSDCQEEINNMKTSNNLVIINNKKKITNCCTVS